jgi:hypothetical protein
LEIGSSNVLDRLFCGCRAQTTDRSKIRRSTNSLTMTAQGQKVSKWAVGPSVFAPTALLPFVRPTHRRSTSCDWLASTLAAAEVSQPSLRGRARAVLLAVRAPSVGMIEAGLPVVGNADLMVAMWQAMVDVALEAGNAQA